MSLRDSILAAPDLVREAVTIAEWQNVTIYVSTMSGHARSQWAAVAFDDAGKVKEPARETLLVHTLTDAEGKPIFTVADITALEGKNAAVLARLFAIAKRLNGLGADEVDEAEKN